jgi:hypothetical protein
MNLTSWSARFGAVNLMIDPIFSALLLDVWARSTAETGPQWPHSTGAACGRLKDVDFV